MKKRFFRTLIISLPLAAVAGFSHAAQDQGVTTGVSSSWGASVNGIQFRAAPLKPEFAVDEPVLVNLEIKTSSNHAIPIVSNNLPDKAFKITLTDSRGKAVPLTRYGKLVQAAPTFDRHSSYANPVTLINPGSKLEYHFWINRMYDMTTPGDYHITFSRTGIVIDDVISYTDK